jgi:two-component system cell cycle sensor histidine kinase/response regulator CckA
MDSVADAVIVLDSDGRCRRANSAAEVMLGFSADEMRDVPLHALLHPEELPDASCPFLRALEIDNAGRPFDVVLATRVQGTLDVEMAGWPLLLEEDRDAFLLTIQCRSLRAAREASHAQNARLAGIGTLAAAVAHEFNNILMGISPFATVVVRKSGEDRQLLKAGENILKAVERAKSVAGEILRFTKPHPVRRTPMDVGTWLRDSMVQLRPMIPAIVHLHLELGTEEMTVEADPIQLSQVLLNLVINARDAMNGPGSIAIVAGRRKNDVQIEVVDSGKGIAPENLKKIFEPLFTTKGSSGTGLGLAVTRRIIEAHDGTIGVVSEEGSGTRFTILLPSLAAVATSKRKVLIMLPAASDSASLSAFLSASGFSCEIVPHDRPVPGGDWLAVVACAASRDRAGLRQVAGGLILIDDGSDSPALRDSRAVRGTDLVGILDILRNMEKEHATNKV